MIAQPHHPKKIIILSPSLSLFSPLVSLASTSCPLSPVPLSCSVLLSCSEKMPTRHATEDFVPATPTPPRSEDTRDPPRPHSKAHNYYNETYDDDLYESPSRYANPRHMYSHGEPGTPLGRNYGHHPSRVPDAPPRSPVMRLASGNHRKITAHLQPRSNSRLPKSLALTPPDNKKPRSWVSISSGSSNPRYHSSTRQKKTQAHDTELQELQELIKDLKTEYRRLHQRTESKVYVSINGFM